LIFQKFSIIKETKFEEQEDDSRNDENYVGNSKVEIKNELISLSKDEKKETIKKEKSDVELWSVEKVCKWIRRIGAVYEEKKYDHLFQQNEINGAALMNMTNGDLKELGIMMGDRIKIMLEINKLK
jgi:hypothetical protein